MDDEDRNKKISRYFKNWRSVWRDGQIPPLAKVLLKDLEEYQNREHIAWPSQATLAKNHGVHGVIERTVRTHLKILQKLGLLTIKRGGYKNTNKMKLSSTLFYPSLRYKNGTSKGVKNDILSLPSESTHRKYGYLSSKKNQILVDPDFIKACSLDPTTDQGHRSRDSLITTLEARYPGFKFQKEWDEANKVLFERRTTWAIAPEPDAKLK